MGIGQFTKHLAQQAIGNQVKDVVEGIAPSEAAPPAPAVVETISAMIVGEVHAMQKGLKDDQELVVTCGVGDEILRVREIYVRSPQLAVLTGTSGPDKTLTRIICPFDSLVLVCKPTAVAAGATAVRVRIVTPKPAA
ncbi:MAG TPA: hypothetical protein VER03_13880 [Bryobacteraceae bacterium]|nr:hypothetical protein [Bryobacteraceae bacterium]